MTFRTFVDKNFNGIKGKAKLLVYLNHFLVGWDDNIWSFALGLFLVEITPQSLTFTAAYGLTAGISVLLFGTVVGDWVDRTSRLTVARLSVLVQNTALIFCCVVIYIVIEYRTMISEALPNEGLLRMCYALIIGIAILSNMTNMARKTAIERDWIVEICDRDKDMLAELSATMRRISLVTMVITPIVTGQILKRTSHSTGALVVAAWNFVTIFAEYFLLWKIYQEVPQLRRDKISENHSTDAPIILMPGVDVVTEFQDLKVETSSSNSDLCQDKDIQNGVHLKEKSDVTSISTRAHRKRSCLEAMCATVITLRRGWVVYKSYKVAFAGLSLASLYLTVLGFHHITVGYAYSQGLSEDLIGGLLAAAAFSGIVGTIFYPRVRRAVGLNRTGLYALGAEVTSLTLCVVSIFCPGSPFDPGYFNRKDDFNDNIINNSTMKPQDIALATPMPFPGTYDDVINMTSFTTSGNITSPWISTNLLDSASTPAIEPSSYVSIALLMTGIIGARVGLWMADLTITQLFLESVDVTERGIVAGFQNALNQLMDMLKYALVILLPVPEVFGYLVIISFSFICLGWVLFAVYVKKTRGYVFVNNSSAISLHPNREPPVDRSLLNQTT